VICWEQAGWGQADRTRAHVGTGGGPVWARARGSTRDRCTCMCVLCALALRDARYFRWQGNDGSHETASYRHLVGQPEYAVAWLDQDRHHAGPKLMPRRVSTEVGMPEILRTGDAGLPVGQLQLARKLSAGDGQ
jgi:hypothetical protein